MDTEEEINKLKYEYLTDILQTENPKTANVLVAYASFLNSLPVKTDQYPLFLQIMGTNNKYAVDALLGGSTPETYLDFVIPNGFIIKTIFEIFSRHRNGELYEMTLRSLCGLLLKVYESPKEGFQIYQLSISAINDLAKFLEESKDQDDPLNRDILDILLYISDLHESHDQEYKDVAWQAGRLRADFFDSERGLKHSLTSKALEKSEKKDFGPRPEYIYQ